MIYSPFLARACPVRHPKLMCHPDQSGPSDRPIGEPADGVATLSGRGFGDYPKTLRGEPLPPKTPPYGGGEHAAGENFEDFGPKTLCFNRDFELIRKIGMLPPTVGGTLGGSFSSFGGEQGGALPPILEGRSYTLTPCCRFLGLCVVDRGRPRSFGVLAASLLAAGRWEACPTPGSEPGMVVYTRHP